MEWYEDGGAPLRRPKVLSRMWLSLVKGPTCTAVDSRDSPTKKKKERETKRFLHAEAFVEYPLFLYHHKVCFFRKGRAS